MLAKVPQDPAEFPPIEVPGTHRLQGLQVQGLVKCFLLYHNKKNYKYTLVEMYTFTDAWKRLQAFKYKMEATFKVLYFSLVLRLKISLNFPFC